MSLALVVLVGVLLGTATYLLLHRSLTRIILGIAMLSNAVNVLLMTSGTPEGEPAITGGDYEGPFADPLPQAFVLTAIVIGLALVAFLLGLAWRSWTIDGNDDVEDDVEDRRLASLQITERPEEAEAEEELTEFPRVPGAAPEGGER